MTDKMIYHENNNYTIDEVRHNRQVWREALLSGEYKQGKRNLRTLESPVTHCCLGVATELAAKVEAIRAYEYLRSRMSLPPKSVLAMLGLFNESGRTRMPLLEIEDSLGLGELDNLSSVSLTLLNDQVGWTFVQIADLVIDEELMPIVLDKWGD